MQPEAVVASRGTGSGIRGSRVSCGGQGPGVCRRPGSRSRRHQWRRRQRCEHCRRGGARSQCCTAAVAIGDTAEDAIADHESREEERVQEARLEAAEVGGTIAYFIYRYTTTGSSSSGTSACYI